MTLAWLGMVPSRATPRLLPGLGMHYPTTLGASFFSEGCKAPMSVQRFNNTDCSALADSKVKAIRDARENAVRCGQCWRGPF